MTTGHSLTSKAGERVTGLLSSVLTNSFNPWGRSHGPRKARETVSTARKQASGRRASPRRRESDTCPRQAGAAAVPTPRATSPDRGDLTGGSIADRHMDAPSSSRPLENSGRGWVAYLVEMVVRLVEH